MDDYGMRARTALAALLLIEGLGTMIAVLALTTSHVHSNWRASQPVAVPVPVAVHVPVDESWVVKHRVLTPGREEVLLFRTESGAALILGGSEATFANTEPEAE